MKRLHKTQKDGLINRTFSFTSFFITIVHENLADVVIIIPFKT
jgi:hypothetical protein